MRLRSLIFCALLSACAGGLAGCGGTNPPGEANTAPAPAADDPNRPYTLENGVKISRINSPLPDDAYRAGITLPEPLAQMRAGQKQTIKVRVKNLSDVTWRVRGTEESNKYYIAVGNRWLDGAGQLVTNMDGRYGLSDNLAPGQETEVPLQVTAPKTPGEYVLDIDLVHEGVTFFHERGSETLKVRVKVG